ncbi:MAG: peptidylprolyl isomerase [Defluviitaleaceae bacterium]|nr:peptidylprolyl isomerase [Defluviitaleaceae bacterium]
MNKERIKGIIIGFALCALLAATTTAVIAAVQSVTKEVTYGVGVTLHGSVIEFSEIDRPFMVDGRVFLPMRAVAELVGLPVDFDTENNMVILGDRDIATIGTVATVNGVEVDATDIGMWLQEAVFNVMLSGQQDDDAVREEAVRLAAIGIMFAEYAAAHDITLSDERIASTHQELAHMRANFGDMFDEIMRSSGFSNEEQLINAMLSFALAEEVVSRIMASDEKLDALGIEQPEEEEVFAAKHILISLDYENAEELAYELLERALAGEDFAALVAEYGQDPGMEQSPEGYTFTRGVMVMPFEQATVELEIGEISGVVYSQFGYHIILRTEPNMDDIMRPWGQESLSQILQSSIYQLFEEKVDDAKIIFLPALELVPVPN